MKNISITPIPGAKHLKKLRNSLAIIHCRRLLSILKMEAEGTVSHDQSKRVTYMTELFSRIHREIFHDWKEQATVSHRPGTMTDVEKRIEFREAIERLVLNNGENVDTAIFDNNGFVIKTANIAERLGNFYRTMRSIRPFGYGNKMTLDLFMIALGNLPAFKGVYEQGIDFRRLEASDAVALHNPKSSAEEVALAFQHALDPSRTRSLENAANGYGKWPEHKKFVAGMPFLFHKAEDGMECLVTVNGGLVPLESVKEKLVHLDMHFADYPLSLSEPVIGYLPGTESLRAPEKREIDGISIGENGKAPLFCLDINMLTGLRSPGHAELMELLQECVGDEASPFMLASNEALKKKLILAATGDARLQRGVEIAYERLGKIKTKLENSKQAIFEGKSPVENPKLFLCMGGAAAGKTAVEEIAKAECGDNFVIASLDEFRNESDLYLVLTAANHHSDDYIFVEPFANTLRDWVAKHAIRERINTLYDGTSIPYIPRYSGIVDKFKRAGFRTLIAAVDAFIVKPRGREEELPRSAVINSVKDRFDTTGRALPWVVAVDKHIRAPGSFLDALEHESLEKISLFANDAERDKHYLVAESFSFSDEEVRALQEHQKADTLAEYLKSIIRTHDDSTLRSLAGGKEDELEALINRNPAFEEVNVAYQIYISKDENRVLAVYNTRRMIDFLEKGQLNPNASGEEGLLHKPESLAFHVDPYTKEPWRIRLQDSAITSIPD